MVKITLDSARAALFARAGVGASRMIVISVDLPRSSLFTALGSAAVAERRVLSTIKREVVSFMVKEG